MKQQLTRMAVCQRFMDSVKHSACFNMTLISANESGVTVRLPWQAKLVGNPETGTLHGGVIFTLMDQCGGLANSCASFPDTEITPTIDMRVDHLRAPTKGEAIICKAECYRRSRQVYFVRMAVYEEQDEGEKDPIATGLATYMRMKIPQQTSNEGTS